MAQNDFWTKLKKRFCEVSSAAADFTEEQAIIGKLKFEILNLKRKFDRKKSSLGGRLFEMSQEDPKPDVFEDIEVISLLSEIEDLENKIDAKNREITEVADHFRTKAEESNYDEEEDINDDEEPGITTPRFEPEIEKDGEKAEPKVEVKKEAKKEEKGAEKPKKEPKTRKRTTARKSATKKKTTSSTKRTSKKPEEQTKKDEPPKEDVKKEE